MYPIIAAEVGFLTVMHFTYRDFENIGERMLNPLVEALRPIADINIESQVHIFLIWVKLASSISHEGANINKYCTTAPFLFRFCTTHQSPPILILMINWVAMSLVWETFLSLYVPDLLWRVI